MDFRELMDIWDERCARERDDLIKSFVHQPSFVIFFKKGDGLYGAPEESRLVFAKLKNPDEEVPDGWADDASFMAVNLLKALGGERTHNVFGAGDLDDIEVMDKDNVCAMLGKKAKKVPDSISGLKASLSNLHHDEI
jgi:hypothetical protein